MSGLTVTQARDSILTLVDTIWTNSVVPLGFEALLYEDRKDDRPQTVDGSGDVRNWGRASVRHSTSRQASLSNENGVRRFERGGLLVVSIFTRQGDGLTLADQAAEALLEGLEGEETADCVLFRNVRYEEQGQDGVWMNTNVFAEFEYDRVG